MGFSIGDFGHWSWPDSIMGDYPFGGSGNPSTQTQERLPNPLNPFLVGYGKDPVVSWAPTYNPAYGYNPFAFPGAPYGGQQYAYGDPFGNQITGASQGQYFEDPLDPRRSAAQQQPGASSATQAGGADTSGGGANQGQRPETGVDWGVRWGNNGTTYSRPTDGSWVPGLFPSAAAQMLYGPEQYYPWMDVAAQTQYQGEAGQRDYDYATGQGQQDVDAIRGLAGNLAGGDYLSNPIQQRTAAYSRSLMNQGLGQDVMSASQGLLGAGDMAAQYASHAAGDPTFQKDFGKYGLGRYIQDYSENPQLTGVINDASNDAIRNTMEYQLRNDRENAIQAGQYGGARSGIAEGMTGRGLAEELGQLATQTRFGDYTNWQDRGLRAGESLVQGDIAAQQAATQRAQIESNHKLGMLDALTRMATGGANMYGIGSNAALGAGDLGNQSSQQAYNLDTLRQQGMTDAADLLEKAMTGEVDLNSLIRDEGTRQQTLNQLFLNSDKNRWDAGQGGGWDLLGKYASILGGVPVPDQGSNTTSTTSGGGLTGMDAALAIMKLIGLGT